MKLPNLKIQLAVFLLVFALYLSFSGKDAIFLSGISIAVITSVSADWLIAYSRDKKKTIDDSAFVTGLIIGYVIATDEPWWVFAAASLLAICSKHFIRVDKKHLFNPAGFGVFCTMILFAAGTQWKVAYMWRILLPAGLYFAYKSRKLEIIFFYGLTSLALFGAQAFIRNSPLVNIFGYFNWFFILIMLIEPKTTPVRNPGKMIFGASAGVLIFMLNNIGVSFDAELFSLLALNLGVPALNKIGGG